MGETRPAERSATELPFAEAVRELIADARNESARLGHEYVGTEHLVLALSHQAGDAAPLPVLGIDPDRVYTAMTGIIQRGRSATEPSLERPFTSRTQRAFALAAESARELGHAQIGVPHVVVGLLRERMNIGALVLADQGLTAERAYDYARRDVAAG